MSSKHSNLVNCISEFLFRAWFLFYDKNGKLICYFFVLFGIIFLDFIKQKQGPK